MKVLESYNSIPDENGIYTNLYINDEFMIKRLRNNTKTESN